MPITSARRTAIHLGLIALLCALAYSNSLHGPFVFDDIHNIVKNSIIRNPGFYVDPQSARQVGEPSEYPMFKSRYVGSLSFALNYAAHGLDVRGYHITNLSIHIAGSLLLYLLIRALLETPRLRAAHDDSVRAGYTALFGALLFALHPVQTQAVTYIVQRFASLASFFYILAVFGYVRSRLSASGSRRAIWYTASILASILAIKTKEIAITLPVTLAMIEWVCFDDGGARRRALLILPFALAMLIGPPLTFMKIGRPFEEIFDGMSVQMGNRQEFTQVEYIATETRVLMTYMRLLLIPINQNVDYDYPISRGFADPGVLMAAGVHLSVLALAGFFLMRARKTRSGLDPIPLGIFWFYLTLLPESGLIPIRDVIFEHRLYLPSMGIAFAASSAVFAAGSRLGKNKRTALVMLSSVAVLSLGAATWNRNSVWKSDISLWEDVVSKAPSNIRAYNNLSNAYLEIKNFGKAAYYAQRAAVLNPAAPGPHNNLGLSYAALGRLDLAIESYQNAERLDPDSPGPINNLGLVLLRQQRYAEAVDAFRKAVALRPDFVEAYANLAAAEATMGRLDEASRQYRAILAFKPEFLGAYLGLARIAINTNHPAQAKALLETALRLAPGNPEALNLYSMVNQ